MTRNVMSCGGVLVSVGEKELSAAVAGLQVAAKDDSRLEEVLGATDEQLENAVMSFLHGFVEDAVYYLKDNGSFLENDHERKCFLDSLKRELK